VVAAISTLDFSVDALTLGDDERGRHVQNYMSEKDLASPNQFLWLSDRSVA
jgi:hypothetical protein